MSMLTITIQNAKGTVNREGAMATARQVGRVEVTNMCRKILNQATVDAPVDTGNLRASHRMRVQELKTRVSGTVSADVKYASAVHDGSPPHTIRARKKKALRFVIGDMVIIRRSVRHPGTKGRPWLREAARRVASSSGWRFQGTTGSE